MDILQGKVILAETYKPKWTCWDRRTVRKHVTAHKRKMRRIYKQYLRTGDVRDYNRSQYLMTRWDFD